LAQGIVLKAQSGSFLVDGGGAVYRCRLRGRMRLDRGRAVLPVAVGDRVEFSPTAEGTPRESPEGAIEKVLPRRSKLSRRASGRQDVEQVLVANLDTLLVVVSVAQPIYRRGLVDRLFVSGEVGGLEPVLVMNKMDLAGEGSEVSSDLAVYEGLGYDVFPTSAVTGEGVGELADRVRGAMSVMVGPSGTGKSSLVNRIEPGLRVRTKEISRKTSKGRHTTTHLELHSLGGGGYMADTPGIREFGLWDVPPGDLHLYFPEMEPYQGSCRFSPCSHSHEPDCAVKEAVEEGRIDRGRHESYCRLLESILEKRG
jgi:ribosome biogenesis GTPase